MFQDKDLDFINLKKYTRFDREKHIENQRKMIDKLSLQPLPSKKKLKKQNSKQQIKPETDSLFQQTIRNISNAQPVEDNLKTFKKTSDNFHPNKPHSQENF